MCSHTMRKLIWYGNIEKNIEIMSIFINKLVVSFLCHLMSYFGFHLLPQKICSYTMQGPFYYEKGKKVRGSINFH